jgi:hypothetical protein
MRFPTEKKVLRRRGENGVTFRDCSHFMMAIYSRQV